MSAESRTAIPGPMDWAGVILSGTLLGNRYKIGERIAEGGQGTVYQAHDQEGGREVVLKVLKVLSSPNSEAEERRHREERFLREVRASARLDHAGLVRVLDVGVDPTYGPFYVMESFHGGDLADAVAKGRLGVREAVAVIRQVAVALAHAHSRGVIHRDVKPHNILLRFPSPSDGAASPGVHALLCDFGLAKLTEPDHREADALTHAGDLLGTPGYTAPEQLENPRGVDLRADIYGLGAALYHATTGEPPFTGSSATAVIDASRERDPIPPRQRNRDVDEALDRLIVTCLARDPKERYQCAAHVAEDCRRWLNREPISAPRISRIVHVWRRVKRRRAFQRAFIGAVASTAASLLVALALYIHLSVLPERAQRQERASLAAMQAARAAEVRVLLATARLALARGELPEADRQASGLLARYQRFYERGERELPIVEAHLVRAEAARMAPQDALRHTYRAYEASIGSPLESSLLATIGERLLDAGDIHGSQGAFTRAIALASGEHRALLKARYGLARSHLALLDMNTGHADLGSLGTSIDALDPPGVARWRRLHGFLYPERRYDVGLRSFVLRDLNSDGRSELVGISPDGLEVFAGQFQGALWQELGRVPVLAGVESYRLSALDAFDLDSDGVREIVVAGGGRNQGSHVAVLGLSSGRLEVLARSVEAIGMGADVPADALAAGDLDGDGRVDLVVGTGMAERALRIYRYRRGSLVPAQAAISLDGDAVAVRVRDSNANGRPEIWCFTGPWGGWGLTALERSAEGGRFERISHTPLAGSYALDPGVSPDAEHLLVGLDWNRSYLRPVRESYGRRRMESEWKPSGVYELRLQTTGHQERVPCLPLRVLPWEDGEGWVGTRARVVSFGDRATRIAWAWVEPTDVSGRAARRIHLWVREPAAGVSTWRPFAVLRPSEDGYLDPRAADLDGDGDDELVVALRGQTSSGHDLTSRVAVLGLAPATAVAKVPRQHKAGSQHPLGRDRVAPRDLVAAREALRLGLWEEAVQACHRVLAQRPSLEAAQEAACGVVASHLAQGNAAEAARLATSLAARYPMLEEPLARLALERLETMGHWALALSMVHRLLRVPGASRSEAAALSTREHELRGLLEPRLAFDLSGNPTLWDLLASSPFAARMDPAGRMTLWSPGDHRHVLLIPLAYDGASWCLEAHVGATRHDWGTSVYLGLASGAPWMTEVLRVSRVGSSGVHAGTEPERGTAVTIQATSGGEAVSPTIGWTLREERGIRSMEIPSPGNLEIRRSVRLEYAAHRRELRGWVDARSALLSQSEPMDGGVFLYLEADGAGSTQHLAAFHIASLRLGSASPLVRPFQYHPRRSLDLLLLANGRMIQRREAEALALYDRAVAAADHEEACTRDIRARGLPSERDLPWAQHSLVWVGIDARLWRAFAHARGARISQAVADFADAHARSPERVRKLVLAAALPLASSPGEVAVLRMILRHLHAHALAQTRDDTTPTPSELFPVWLLHTWGPDLAHALLAADRWVIRRRLVLSGVHAPPGLRISLAPGDEILSYDGRAVESRWSVLRRYQGEVRDSAKTSVFVEVRRGSEIIRAVVDPRCVDLLAVETHTLQR